MSPNSGQEFHIPDHPYELNPQPLIQNELDSIYAGDSIDQIYEEHIRTGQDGDINKAAHIRLEEERPIEPIFGRIMDISERILIARKELDQETFLTYMDN